MSSQLKTTPAGTLPTWTQFLKDMFGPRAYDVWVCGFQGDPGGPAASWAGGTARDKFAGSDLTADAFGTLPNIYFVPYLFENGAKRDATNFESAWVIPVDDVGYQADVAAEKTRYSLECEDLKKWKAGGKKGPKPVVTKMRVKTSRERLLELFGPPTLAMVTSKHGEMRNEQWFYRLDKACTDGAKVAALAVAIGSDAKGLTRYVRLPGGANQKPAHGPGGFVSELGETGYDLSRVFDIDAMILASKADVAAEAAKIAKTNDPDAPTKPEFLALEAAGLIKHRIGGSQSRGWVMECPGNAHGEADGGWIGSDEGHTPGTGTEAHVWENGGFECFHGHCSGRNFNDLAQWVARHPAAGPELKRIHNEAPPVFSVIEDTSEEAQPVTETDTPQASPLPIIRTNQGTLASRVKQALAALAQRGDVYQRGGAPVMIKRTPLRGARGKRHSLTITQLDTAGLLSVLSEAAIWGTDKVDANGRRSFVPSILPPEKVALAILSPATDLHPLPSLAGTIRTPFIRCDGTVAQADGAAHYDADSELYVDPDGVQYPEVRDAECTRDDALRALAALRAPINEYKFDGPVSAAVALAALMMPFVRPAVDLVPGIAIDAPTKGSGKTMLASLPAILATGEPPPLIAPTRGEEELDKQFKTALLGGASLVVIDNVEGSQWGTPTICAALTGHTLKVRILGKSVERDLPNTGSLIVTGNNLAFPGDTTRRFLVCRINPGVERPDTLRFKRNPREDVARDRAKLAHAALTILRAYVVAGAPPQGGQAMGSFEQYTGLVRDALMWLGLPDVATSTDTASAAETANPELLAVLKAWKAMDDAYPFDDAVAYTAGDLVNAANQTDPDTGHDAYPGLRTALAAVCPKGLTSQSLGYWLRQHKDRFAGGMSFTLDGADRTNARAWRLLTSDTPPGADTSRQTGHGGFAPLE